MAYHKLFKYSQIFISGNVGRFILQNENKNCIQVVYEIKIAALGSNSTNRCHYSTLLPRQNQHSFFKLLPHRSLVQSAFLTTGDLGEKYEVVTTHLNLDSADAAKISLPISESIKSTDVVASDATVPVDIASSSTVFTDNVLSEAVEPTLESLGLAHWTPVGLVQMLLENLHVGYHMPWWLAIVSCTIAVRILMIPILIKTQRNALNMSNYMPKLQYLQTKFGEARRSGNSMAAAKYAAELMAFMKEHNISPLKNALIPLLQAPVFVSFFLALRGMANAPVESMKTGGISWVTDLTVPDPYYILPLVSCGTLYVVLKIGAESGVRMENLKMAKYFLQALPVIAFPFCIFFPSAVLYYWVTTNFCTLAIVSVLKIKSVRNFCKLPVQQPIDPKFSLPKKGFIEGIKEAYEDQKVLANVEDRRRMDEIRFQKAGTGPVPRTYSYDPTKPKPSNVESIVKNIAAKKRGM